MSRELDMQQWEYLTTFVFANINNPGARETVTGMWPEWTPPYYTPESMIPNLDAWGAQGWELVHMEPVAVGSNYDVHFQGQVGDYSNAYFCVFKRPRP